LFCQCGFQKLDLVVGMGRLGKVMKGFKGFCGLPYVHGAIDVTQIYIQKPHNAFIGDYFSFKSKGYNMQL